MNETSKPQSEEFEDPLSDYEPTEYETELHRALAEDTVESVTATPFFSIGPETEVREAIEKMAAERSACLLVVEEGRVLGILTERDVLERVAEQFDKLADGPVRDVMTAEPTVVYESDPAATAVAAIAVAGHRHVPVLKVDGTLAGVIGPRRVFEFVDRFLDA